MITGVVGVLLVVLMSLQFRAWRNFNWHVFWQQTKGVNLLCVAGAIAFIHTAYWLRALRWRIFLTPLHRTTSRRLLPPTLIGFAALALLGRPGELIRPYLIARREGLPFPSQLAVWTVERMFDIGAFATLLVLDIFIAPNLPYVAEFRKAGFMLMALVLGLALGAFAVRRNRTGVADWVKKRLSAHWPRMGREVARRIEAFGEGLYTIREPKAFVQVFAVSMMVWVSIASAATSVMHAYPQPLRSLRFSQAVLVVAFSMAGSFLNLPTVGGGTQLAVFAGLAGVLAIPRELALSSGLMLWLVGYVSVIPLGLALAHREHVSLRRLARETASAG